MKSRSGAGSSAGRIEGLCVTCENDADCTFPRRPDRPVIECEEFSAAPAPAPRSEAPEGGPARREAARSDEGLCSNCDNRDGCTFPNARAGVTECEEYA